MRLYFAPLEGFTDALFRRAHHDLFPGLDKYFMPFLSPAHSLHFTAREAFDFSPAQNAGVPAVPQILARDPAYFLGTVQMLRDAGYTEVNLNTGCPSGTVTAKSKGAGMLRKPEELARFLDAIFAQSPLPISVKTRVGFDAVEEWDALWKVFCQYPFRELILHPRTSREYYHGAAHRDMLSAVLDTAPFPIVYNGDVFTAGDGQEMIARFPRLSGLMLGRGLTANPALGREILGGPRLTKEDLIAFHDRLYRSYLRFWPATAAVGRMHAVMGYLGQCFDHAGPPLRALRRSTTPHDYDDAVERLFRECPLKETPLFIPPP